MSVPKNQQDVLDFTKSNCYIKDGLLRSKTVWGITLVGKPKKHKYIRWQIVVGIMNPTTKKRIPVTAEYINRKTLPSGYYAITRTVSGHEDGKPTMSDPTWTRAGKSAGRNNETTPFTQAILNARTLFNNKIRKGGVTDKSQLLIPGQVSIEQLIKRSMATPWRIFPMALHNVTKTTPSGTSNWRHLTYPGLIQPKYDGTRFLVMHHPLLKPIDVRSPTEVEQLKIDGYSRGRETYEGQDHILYELYQVLKQYPGLYIDGELWKEGYGLQDVSGSSRRQQDSSRGESIKLDYYIFDCFQVDKPDLTFMNRRALLREVYDKLQGELGYAPKYIKIAPDREYKSQEEAVEYYQEYLEQGLEGGVLRNKDSIYKFGVNKELRSYTTLKIKPMDDDEWPVIGWTQGSKGKDVGALKWILQVTPETVKLHKAKYDVDAKYPEDPKDRTWESVTKGLDYDQRYAAFKFFTDNPGYFEKHFKNKLMSVQFSIISNFGKPQQTKVLGFRDKKLQQQFMDVISGNPE